MRLSLFVVLLWSVGDRVGGSPPRDSFVRRYWLRDPRLAKMMELKSMPFDSKRMVYGGFKTMVDL